MPGGRPSKFTPELAKEICDRIAHRESTRKVCAALGISYVTLFDWLDSNHEFSKQYTRAKEIAMEAMAEEILEISDNTENDRTELGLVNHENINRSRLKVDTRKWLMSKLAPKRYGEKVQTDIVSSDGSLPAIFVDAPPQETRSEWEKRILKEQNH